MSSLASSSPGLFSLSAPLRSRYLLGAYLLAVILTGWAVWLAASPPASGDLAPVSSLILTLLAFNLVLILGVGAAVGLRLLALRSAQASDAGARVHLRFVGFFAIAAVVPAFVVALFYGALVTRGVDNWFSHRVQTVVENSATVARSYLDEQQRYIGDHVTVIARELNGAAPALQESPVAFSHYLADQASTHGFPAIYLIDREGRVLARAEAPGASPFVVPPESSFQFADQGEIAMRIGDTVDVMRAVYRLSAYEDAYLYVVRPVEGGIISHLREAESSLVAYREAKDNRQQIQTVFIVSYIETVLLVLVGATWVGMALANAISGPIGRLVQAAGRVSAGDLTARVDSDGDFEEIAVLSRAFNRMTNDLQVQQAALRQAGLEAQERRQFIETVLLEVSAGVVAVEPGGRISAANRQAVALLELGDGIEGRGRRLAEAAPEFGEVAARAEAAGEAEEEVDIVRDRKNYRVRVRASRSENGLVLTFDDITRLVAAQRNAAWKDVARRIAHEIKNPLTPIQLSAERIRRKFRRNVADDDLEIFDRCTDTIVRQVGDIGRMVDEFSSFARMPAPKFAETSAAELIRAAVFAQRVASADIEVTLDDPVPDETILADSRMLSQALTNILKNAAEAIAARQGGDEGGRITARLLSDEHGLAFEVEDNGVGLPTKDRERLTEPYVTTREKGTGLGLAIVKRIMEDHGGELALMDAASGQGAKAVLRLPASARVRRTPAAEAASA